MSNNAIGTCEGLPGWSDCLADEPQLAKLIISKLGVILPYATTKFQSTKNSQKDDVRFACRPTTTKHDKHEEGNR